MDINAPARFTVQERMICRIVTTNKRLVPAFLYIAANLFRRGTTTEKECFDGECMCNENSIPDPCHSIPSSPFEIIPGLQSLLSMYTDETNCCMSKPTSSGSACATVSESHVPLRRDHHALYNDSIPQCFSSIPTDYSHR